MQKLILGGDEIEKLTNYMSKDKVYEINIKVIGDRNITEEDLKDIKKQIDKAIKESK